MITLDIEDTCIRMMVVNGRKVELAATLPLEPGLVEDGVIVEGKLESTAEAVVAKPSKQTKA